MNADPAFLRTRIRHEVLPGLERAAGFPVVPRLAAFARLAAEDEALLGTLADGAWSRLVLSDGSLDAVGVRALEPPLRRRVLARLLSEAGAEVDDASLARALGAMETGRAVTLRGGHSRGGLQLRAAGGRVRCVRPETRRESPPVLELAGEGASGLQPGTGWAFRVAPGPPPPGTLGLPLPEGTRWPLRVRTRRPGDRVRGAAGSRKLQDVLVDGRVPAERRDSLPVVTDAGGDVLWVPGVWNSTAAGAVRLFLWAHPPVASTPGTRPL